MKAYLLAYVGALVAFLACDAMWLSATASTLYRPVMGDMMLDSFRPVPAVLFYLIYVGAIVILAIRPESEQSIMTTVTWAGVLGFAAFATYDLTNQATLKNWSTGLTCADLAWGTLVSMVAASAGRIICRLF